MRRILALSLALVSMACLPTLALAQVRADRLERLAAHLERDVPPGRFDIQSWGTDTDASASSFVGCAAGYATQIPEFRRDGLTLREIQGRVEPIYKEHRGMSAAAAFFGLSWDQAMTVFNVKGYDDIPGSRYDPHAAAAKLRALAGRESVAMNRDRPPNRVTLCLVAEW